MRRALRRNFFLVNATRATNPDILFSKGHPFFGCPYSGDAAHGS